MRKPSLIVYGLALLVPPLAASHPAEAGILVNGVVGGSSTGAIQETFDSLVPGDDTPTTLAFGLTIYSDGDAGPVSGSVPNVYAAPDLSGGNGLGFGPSSSTQTNGVDGTTSSPLARPARSRCSSRPLRLTSASCGARSTAIIP